MIVPMMKLSLLIFYKDGLLAGYLPMESIML